MQSSQKWIVHRSKEIIWRRNHFDEVIVVSLSKQAEDFKITGLAAEIWERFDGKKNLGHVIDDLMNKYELSKEETFAQAEVFIESLDKNKLVLVKK